MTDDLVFEVLKKADGNAEVLKRFLEEIRKIEDESYDPLYSRHSLEHSPMPLLTLMEWHRITKKYLAVAVPSIEFVGYTGRNHYYILNQEQWKNLFNVAGFDVIFEKNKRYRDEKSPDTEVEYWFLLEARK